MNGAVDRENSRQRGGACARKIVEDVNIIETIKLIDRHSCNARTARHGNSVHNYIRIRYVVCQFYIIHVILSYFLP